MRQTPEGATYRVKRWVPAASASSVPSLVLSASASNSEVLGPTAIEHPKFLEQPRCEGEDLNLHGSYPASTSIQVRITEQACGPETVARRLPGAEPDTLLANEAQALLDAAAGQQQVETERLRAFARACLEMSETGDSRWPCSTAASSLRAVRSNLPLTCFVTLSSTRLETATRTRSRKPSPSAPG